MSEPQPPKGLNPWGKKLWDDVTESTEFDAAGYFILAEACRTADIIERLSGMLKGKSTEWIKLSDDIATALQVSTGGMEVAEVHLVVNPIISEIRQQRLALRQLLAQLKLGNTEAGTEGQSTLDKLIANFALPE
ncbi:hypothetical protein [Mycolicibacterium palauense]|uniref:hypothetical protein n=1 Tax=Mycolicibacterium palauense TaxID=2034511 RepID=UPI000BFEF7CB|nr:hypothetical protein [Mycolicibacterium palauense]